MEQSLEEASSKAKRVPDLELECGNLKDDLDSANKKGIDLA